MTAQLPLALTSSLDDALPAAFKISGDRIPRHMWDRFQTHLAEDMRRRTYRERVENRSRTGNEQRRYAIQMTPEERAEKMDARRDAVLDFLGKAPATNEQIRDAIAAEHPLSRESLGAFLITMRDKGLVTAEYNRIKSKRCALWFKK